MSPASDFLRVLVEIARGPQRLRKTFGRFALALLHLGPESVGNWNCSRHLTLRRFKLESGHPATGLTLKPSGLQVSDVVYSFERDRTVRFLKTRFPKLSHEEAKAAFRLVTLTFISVEHTCKRPRAATKPWDRKAVEHEAAFLRSLIEISKGPRDLKAALARLTSALLLVGSETDDNMNCVKHLALGEFRQVLGHRATGLELRPSKIRVAQVLSSLECGETVRWLVRQFTRLSRPEARAAVRLMALTFAALEHTCERTNRAVPGPTQRPRKKAKQARDAKARPRKATRNSAR